MNFSQSVADRISLLTMKAFDIGMDALSNLPTLPENTMTSGPDPEVVVAPTNPSSSISLPDSNRFEMQMNENTVLLTFSCGCIRFIVSYSTPFLLCVFFF